MSASVKIIWLVIGFFALAQSVEGATAPAETAVARHVTAQAAMPSADTPAAPADGAAVRIDARSAQSYELFPAVGTTVVIALDAGGADLDLIVTQGDRYLAYSIDTSPNPIVLFRAPGGAVRVDVVNATDKGADYGWLQATLQRPSPSAVQLARDDK